MTSLTKYWKAGDMLQVRDDLRDIDYNYTYDKLHRLVTETNTGAYAPLSFTYNAIGNIMTKTVGSATFDYAYDTDHKHAVKTITINSTPYQYVYDEVGNMTSGPDFTDPAQTATRTITYNANNMPVSIEHTKGGNTVTTAFLYDGTGSRAKKTVSGGSTTYYIGAHFEIKDGVATKYIFAGNLRIAQVKGTELNYFHKDHLGSSTAMTDSAGATVETAEYMPFGSMRDHSGQAVSDYKFTDQELDAESGLYNYNARLYDPVIGRFISADPTIPRLYDPQSLNRYTYCRNNPLVYVDPTGLESFFVGLSFSLGWGPWGFTAGIGLVYDTEEGLGAYYYDGSLDGFAASGGVEFGYYSGSIIEDEINTATFGAGPASVGLMYSDEWTNVGNVYTIGPELSVVEGSVSRTNTRGVYFNDVLRDTRSNAVREFSRYEEEIYKLGYIPPTDPVIVAWKNSKEAQGNNLFYKLGYGPINNEDQGGYGYQVDGSGSNNDGGNFTDDWTDADWADHGF